MPEQDGARCQDSGSYIRKRVSRFAHSANALLKGTASAVPYKAREEAALAAEVNVSEKQLSPPCCEMTKKTPLTNP